jgi:hypothetical protein
MLSHGGAQQLGRWLRPRDTVEEPSVPRECPLDTGRRNLLQGSVPVTVRRRPIRRPDGRLVDPTTGEILEVAA